MCIGLLLRGLAAGAHFFNADEALHYWTADQPGPIAVYKESLKNAHPPLYFMSIYLWHFVAHSDVTLRLLSVLAGVVFLWFLYKWTVETLGTAAALCALSIAAFSPSLVALQAELRGYALFLLWAIGSLYFLERKRYGVSAALLCLALLSHYAALLFAAGYGVYAWLKGDPLRKWLPWQAGVWVLAGLLWATHLRLLHGGAMEQEAQQQWLREFYLRHGESIAGFLWRQTASLFRYLFAAEVAGFLAFLLFVAGMVWLVRGRKYALAGFAGVPIALAMIAGCLGVYPYGGSRHQVILLIPTLAVVSLFLSWLLRDRIEWMLLLLAVAIPVWRRHPYPAFQPPPPYEKRENMEAAVQFIETALPPGTVLFTDYQTSLVLGFYMSREAPRPDLSGGGPFWEFRFGGYPVIASRRWSWTPQTFKEEWAAVRRLKGLPAERPLQVVTIGSGATLVYELTQLDPAFQVSDARAFGNAIVLFSY